MHTSYHHYSQQSPFLTSPQRLSYNLSQCHTFLSKNCGSQYLLFFRYRRSTEPPIIFQHVFLKCYVLDHAFSCHSIDRCWSCTSLVILLSLFLSCFGFFSVCWFFFYCYFTYSTLFPTYIMIFFKGATKVRLNGIRPLKSVYATYTSLSTSVNVCNLQIIFNLFTLRNS